MSFIKLDRAILKRPWYKDGNAVRLYTHILLMADYTNGTLATHQKDLAQELGLSIQNIKTALKKLESTGDIIRSTEERHLVITIIAPDKANPETNHKLTPNQPHANAAPEPNTEDKATTNQPETNLKLTPSNNIYKYIYINNNKKKERSARTHVCEFDNIKLLKTEYKALVEEYGQELVDEAIKQVSLYSRSKGKTYADAGAAIRRWGIAAARERRPAKKQSYIKREYDEAFFNALIDN